MAAASPNTSYRGDISDQDSLLALGLSEAQFEEVLNAARLASVTS
jgi:hypothetical protein